MQKPNDGEPWYVREVDEDTGVGDSFGTPYTYEHVDDRPTPSHGVCKITCVIDYASTSMHKNVYYLEKRHLEDFLGDRGNLFEEIVDIETLTYEEAEQEFTSFEGTDD